MAQYVWQMAEGRFRREAAFGYEDQTIACTHEARIRRGLRPAGAGRPVWRGHGERR